MNISSDRSWRGFTLIEIIVVVAVLAIVAALAAPLASALPSRSRRAAAEREMKALRAAFIDGEFGYIRDMRGLPGFSVGFLRIANLLIATNLYGAIELADGKTEGRRVDAVRQPMCASPEKFTKWDEAKGRGWRGPYIKASVGEFPADKGRGFYPDLSSLRVPADFANGLNGCSIYGFHGEPSVNDPWGNPYVLQIPPPQAFADCASVTDEERFAYARIVSAGPDGILSTPCFGANATNDIWATVWNRRTRRLSRQAGLIMETDGTLNRAARGDDLVLFLNRNDIDGGNEE